MYDNNLVSVIIPVYNSERYIERTINSVLNQTYKYIEIMVVDDCSTDKSAKIVHELQQNNNKIIYTKFKINQGVAVARNTALSLAKGRYVAFLDSDDIWYQKKIEQQLILMHDKHASFSYTAIEMINDNDAIIKAKRTVKEKVDYDLLLHNTMIATSSVVIDRGILGDFKMPLLRSGQDYATWLILLKKCKYAYGINETLVQYRVRNDSLSSKKLKSIQQVWTIQRNMGINVILVAINVCFFVYNALKKYIL